MGRGEGEERETRKGVLGKEGGEGRRKGVLGKEGGRLGKEEGCEGGEIGGQCILVVSVLCVWGGGGGGIE